MYSQAEYDAYRSGLIANVKRTIWWVFTLGALSGGFAGFFVSLALLLKH